MWFAIQNPIRPGLNWIISGDSVPNEQKEAKVKVSIKGSEEEKWVEGRK